MATVALIGVDGAGKTTIAHMLLESFPLPLKYLYMGTSVESSNHTLPTTRLVLYLKKWAYNRAQQQKGAAPSVTASTQKVQYRNVERGKLGAAARLLNRVAEEWYRQLISWRYQRQGYIVLFDRHFTFEFATQSHTRTGADERMSDRLHLWILQHLYPQPGLVIFLDAEPEVLLARKNEWPLEHLQQYRAAFLTQGEKTKNFVCVDASQPLDLVLQAVRSHILAFVGQLEETTIGTCS